MIASRTTPIEQLSKGVRALLLDLIDGPVSFFPKESRHYEPVASSKKVHMRAMESAENRGLIAIEHADDLLHVRLTEQGRETSAALQRLASKPKHHPYIRSITFLPEAP
jgi:hypothetical protein